MKLRDNQALRDEVRREIIEGYGTGMQRAERLLDIVDRALTATGPGSGVAWVEFPGDGQLPAERRDVLVTIAAGEGGHQAAVAVGYLRHGSRGPFWVVTGMGRPFTVTHWCDCLGDGWRSPAWPNSAGQHGRGPVAAPQIDHRAAPATDRHGNTLVPCASCGEVTAYIATETCDPCWEKAHPAPATPPSGSPPAVTEPRGMTDAETAAHLRKYVGDQRSMPFSWATDACGYDQHIRFVEHRNKNWQAAHDNGDTFDQFILAYADALDPSAPAAALGEPVTSGSPPGAAEGLAEAVGLAAEHPVDVNAWRSQRLTCTCFHAPEQHAANGCQVFTLMNGPCLCAYNGRRPPESPDGSSAPPSGER